MREFKSDNGTTILVDKDPKAFGVHKGSKFIATIEYLDNNIIVLRRIPECVIATDLVAGRNIEVISTAEASELFNYYYNYKSIPSKSRIVPKDKVQRNKRGSIVRGGGINLVGGPIGNPNSMWK